MIQSSRLIQMKQIYLEAYICSSPASIWPALLSLGLVLDSGEFEDLFLFRLTFWVLHQGRSRVSLLIFIDSKLNLIKANPLLQVHLDVLIVLKIWVNFQWNHDKLTSLRWAQEFTPSCTHFVAILVPETQLIRMRALSIFPVSKYFNHQHLMITGLSLFSVIILGWSSFNIKVISQKYKGRSEINKNHMESLVSICAQCCLNLWC